MPTYEYESLERGHRFEEFQSITEPPLERCPHCGGPVRRRIGAGAGVLFKGSGFYQTDYRSESYRKAARADSGSGKEAAGASKETGSTSKPDKSGTPGAGKPRPAGEKKT